MITHPSIIRLALASLTLFACSLAHALPDSVKTTLQVHCVSCHNPDKIKGDLLMHTRAALIEGGESGTAIVPGKPEESPLFYRAALPHDDDDIMPPKGDPLSKAELDGLKKWIAEGAKMPAELVLSPMTKEEAAAIASAKNKANNVRQLVIYPPTIQLETKRDSHQFVATVTYNDDTTQDVTDLAKISVADPKIAKIEGDRILPLADGQTELIVHHANKESKIPVKVSGATTDRPISFHLDVMPVFMRENCNSGGCHGASRGQDRFRLSLFGFDPGADYHSLTREFTGRRVNLAVPKESFLILKSMEKVPHTGGKLFDENSDSYKTLVEWIEKGAENDPGEIPTVTNVEIFPQQAVIEGKGATQQLTVRATYSDGTDRDVTQLCVFSTNNEPTAAVSENGLVTASSRGEAFVMARFDTFTVGTQVLALPSGMQYQKPNAPVANYIDEHVNRKLHQLRLVPSDQCDDRTFLRRVHIDITGTFPSLEEQNAFLADKAPDKRTKLIDRLLATPEFSEMWVMKWAELLQIHSSANDRRYYKGALRYHDWLKEKVSANVPINEIIVELLSSSGTTFKNPAVNYYEMERDPLVVTENVAQVFMGMRIQCAQCHNHPFDRWTMDDYYGFAAFFSQVGRKRGEDPREQIVYNRGSGETNHPVTKKPKPPKFLGAEAPEIASGEDRRLVAAKWLASPENPFFARNLANIVWDHFFGLGIINPVDDVRVSNPASNPELLQALADRLTETNYDFRSLVREICNSAAYQRSTIANNSNRHDSTNFARAQVRRMRAEVILDAIAEVTNSPNKFKGLPLGARAVQIADGSTSNYFLTTFGRAERATVCSCEVAMEPNLSQALHLLNGEAAHKRIKDGKVIEGLIKEEKNDQQIIETLYQRTFARKPTPQELLKIQEAISSSPKEERQAVLEDTFWALLNSKEFIFNH